MKNTFSLFSLEVKIDTVNVTRANETDDSKYRVLAKAIDHVLEFLSRWRK